MTLGIAGASGFIGSYLLERFSAAGQPLRALVRSATLATSRRSSAVEVIQGDLLSERDCRNFLDGLDVIVYLAHRNSPVNSDLDVSNDALSNLVPFLQFLKTAASAGRKPHIVYFSSGGAVYGQSSRRAPFRETDPCDPVSSYGIQKLAAETYLRHFARKGVLTSVVIRPANAYGKLLPRERRQGLIGVALNCLLHGEPVRIFGSLANVRDYIHVSDIASLVDRCLKPAKPFDIYNCGTQVGHSVRDVCRLIERIGKRKLEIVHESAGADLADWCVVDRSKARDELGWEPRIDLESGIRSMLRQEPG
jgi:UDP-glucose 4-epimerase